jgi:ubiquinol-cytochrome c reductase iron-sulfur subunit
MPDQRVDNGRRWLLASTAVAGGAIAAGVVVPILWSMAPSARAKAAGAPVEVDISKIEPGMKATFEWRGKPVWVIRRNSEMLENLKKGLDQLSDPDSDTSVQPEYAKNADRSRKPEYLVLEGVCTHLGCSPSDKLKAGVESGLGDAWLGGFYCACHGSKFDLAGRVLKGSPAPLNLRVPPHVYLSDTKLLIGSDGKES